MQHYVIKFVTDLRHVGGFLAGLRFTPPIKLTATITEILLKVALDTLTHLFCQQLSFHNKLNIHCGVLIESKKK